MWPLQFAIGKSAERGGGTMRANRQDPAGFALLQGFSRVIFPVSSVRAEELPTYTSNSPASAVQS